MFWSAAHTTSSGHMFHCNLLKTCSCTKKKFFLVQFVLDVYVLGVRFYKFQTRRKKRTRCRCLERNVIIQINNYSAWLARGPSLSCSSVCLTCFPIFLRGAVRRRKIHLRLFFFTESIHVNLHTLRSQICLLSY
jgi:hypothetical protein